MSRDTGLLPNRRDFLRSAGFGMVALTALLAEDGLLADGARVEDEDMIRVLAGDGD